MEEVKDLHLGANVLPGGDFEAPPDREMKGWFKQEPPSLDDVTAEARRVTDQPEEGRQCLMLQLSPKDKLPAAAGAGAVVRGHPQPGRPPGAGDAGRRQRLGARAGGDHGLAGRRPVLRQRRRRAAGGAASPGRRSGRSSLSTARSRPSGVVNVTLALTGLGTVYFDDVRIEPLVGDTAAAVGGPTAPGS